MKEVFQYSKVREVKSPARGNLTDAGIDFFIPEDFQEQTLEPNQSILIPSGIVTLIKEDYMGLFLNKSGIAAKYKLLVGAQVIDTGYDGEVHINLHNVGLSVVTLSPGMKICQLVLVPIVTPIPMEMKREYIKEENAKLSNRGFGGFGSTGEK